MFLAVEFRPHKIEAVFCWVRGSFYRFGLWWEFKMLWVRVMGVTLVISRPAERYKRDCLYMLDFDVNQIVRIRYQKFLQKWVQRKQPNE
jgi:hypothetical protein